MDTPLYCIVVCINCVNGSTEDRNSHYTTYPCFQVSGRHRWWCPEDGNGSTHWIPDCFWSACAPCHPKAQHTTGDHRAQRRTHWSHSKCASRCGQGNMFFVVKENSCMQKSLSCGICSYPINELLEGHSPAEFSFNLNYISCSFQIILGDLIKVTWSVAKYGVPTYNPYWYQDLNLQTQGCKSDSLTIRPRLPLSWFSWI